METKLILFKILYNENGVNFAFESIVEITF